MKVSVILCASSVLSALCGGPVFIYRDLRRNMKRLISLDFNLYMLHLV